MRLVYALAVVLLLVGCGKSPAPEVEAQSITAYKSVADAGWQKQELKFKSVADADEQKQELKFNTKFYDAVDKWVAFKTRNDSLYLAGFIYFDIEAAFTFQFEADFAITNKGLEKRKEYSDNIFKIRLSENIADVAILSEKEVEQLGLPKVPDWLKSYKTYGNSNLFLVRIGYSYNHVGASHKAIEPLLKVYNKDPHFEGLEFELAYAYNATENFDKAIDVLNKAIKNDPKNFWFYKELGFALIHQNKLEDAEEAYLKGIELSAKKEYLAEMAQNMAYGYFLIRNKPKFEEWAKLTKKYADENSQFYNNINYFEENWDK
jgi:tetratricopeptide (TPR) repeat protein